jgi:hypothetical protein
MLHRHYELLSKSVEAAKAGKSQALDEESIQEFGKQIREFADWKSKFAETPDDPGRARIAEFVDTISRDLSLWREQLKDHPDRVPAFIDKSMVDNLTELDLLLN